MTSGRVRTSAPRTADWVYDTIRDEILDGTRKPGEKLTETLIATELGVSRTPVRTALQALAGDGFVDSVAHSGTVVKRRSSQQIADIYDVRVLIEGEASALAASRARPGEIDALKEICEKMEAASAEEEERDGKPADLRMLKRLSELNREFHLEVLKVSGNSALRESGERLLEIGFLINTYKQYSRSKISRSLVDHRHLVEALSSGDADWCRSVMRAHILRARHTLRHTN